MDINDQNLPVVATPESPVQQGEVIEGIPRPFKVQDYDDAIPVGKSVSIVGGILLLIVGIFFLAKTSRPTDLTPDSNQLDFSKMNAKQQPQRQGQVAGAQTYGPQGAPPASTAPTDKATKTPTPTEAASPTPTSSPTPKPTEANTPTPTPTPTHTPTPTEATTPTPTAVTPSPSTSPTP